MLFKMKLTRGYRVGAIWIAALLLTAPVAQAVTLGFIETFDSGVAGWEDNVNNPLTAVASGGEDGGAYASTTFNYNGFSDPFGGGGPVTFRASFATTRAVEHLLGTT